MTTKRTPAVPFDDIPGEITTGKIPEGADYEQITRATVGWLNNLQKDRLAPNAIWRDFLSLTDNFRTLYSSDVVYDTFQKLSDVKKRSIFETGSIPTRLVPSGEASWLNVNLAFTVQDQDLVGNCNAFASVTQDADGKWKIWMLRTWLENYEGHGHPDLLEPVPSNGHVNRQANGGPEGTKHVHDVIIVGGGQSGLGAAGRCKALGIEYILFDDRPAIGDSWAHRYDSLKWHTTKDYGNLPFGRTFKEEDPLLLPIERIASGYRDWAERFDLNVHNSEPVDHADWDHVSSVWTVYTGALGDQGEYKARNLVLCMGPGHKREIVPTWAERENVQSSGFKGTVQHSVGYKNCKGFEGKRGVVVGTANSAHDVAEDMARAEMDVTMLQRSPTFIEPGKWLQKANTANYHLGKPTDEADREQLTAPQKISRELINRGTWKAIEEDTTLWDDLEKAGFKCDRYGDLFTHLYIRFGGHYVDVGNCKRIIEGQVKVKGVPVKCLTEDGISFEDGSHLPADLIVCCTGFNHDFRKDAAEIVGNEIAEQMDDYWGVDKEGELRGFCRLAGHPHLFYHGGEARLARFYSRFLALQLQKLKLGRALVPYEEGK